MRTQLPFPANRHCFSRLSHYFKIKKSKNSDPFSQDKNVKRLSFSFFDYFFFLFDGMNLIPTHRY